MVDPQSRTLCGLFWLACMPIRLLVATAILVAIREKGATWIRLAMVFLVVAAAGFAIQFVRTALGTLSKGGFGGEIWWQELRLFHALCYAVAAALIHFDSVYGACLLFVDPLVGAACWFGRNQPTNEPKPASARPRFQIANTELNFSPGGSTVAGEVFYAGNSSVWWDSGTSDHDLPERCDSPSRH